MSNVTMCHLSHFMGTLNSCCEEQRPRLASTSQRLSNANMFSAKASAVAEVGL